MSYMVNWKKEFPCKCISKNFLFIDTEQLSKMWISSQVFFKDFVDRFGTAYFKNVSLWRFFVDRFQKSYLSKNWIISKVFLKDFDHRFENIYNKNDSLKGTLKMKCFGSCISCILSSANSYMNMLVYS